jgi:Protein of unknown function (DUF2975)
MEGIMRKVRLDTWLRRLRGTATFVYIAALGAAVALMVIGFIPRSPVTLELPAGLLSGLDGVGGVVSGAVVDPAAVIGFKITDPSLAQRMIYLATTLPGLLLVAEIARRMAKLLRSAEHTDPFATTTARELTVVAKITAFGGLGVWVVSAVANWGLSATTLEAGTAVEPHGSPFAWLAVGLIFAAFAQLIARGVDMATELDTVI